MARWPAGTRNRLQRAAIELFAERGYDRTTVAEITERADLTERTFYNHFTDKREAFFAGQDEIVTVIVDAVAAAPPDQPPLTAVAAGFVATAGWFHRRREPARLRQQVIDAHLELRERELTKIADLSAAIAGALRDRGTSGSDAVLATAAGMAAFQLALTQWLADPDAGDLGVCIRSAVDDLRSLTAL